ncbi:MAG: hypothetical protein BGP16_15475 [Sphingobium sp. 66-54]|nr:MAG: hypothetical protein BGP16_15475 [Sphingobium sp. 66-54]
MFSVRLANMRTTEEPAPDISGRTLASVGNSYLRIRRQRSSLVGHELTEPAWDILLDLFSSTALGRRVSVSSACIAADVPPTTALRHLRLLEESGLVSRMRDEKDGRRVYMVLSAQGERIARAFLIRVAKL